MRGAKCEASGSSGGGLSARRRWRRSRRPTRPRRRRRSSAGTCRCPREAASSPGHSCLGCPTSAAAAPSSCPRRSGTCSIWSPSCRTRRKGRSRRSGCTCRRAWSGRGTAPSASGRRTRRDTQVGGMRGAGNEWAAKADSGGRAVTRAGARQCGLGHEERRGQRAQRTRTAIFPKAGWKNRSMHAEKPKYATISPGETEVLLGSLILRVLVGRQSNQDAIQLRGRPKLLSCRYNGPTPTDGLTLWRARLRSARTRPGRLDRCRMRRVRPQQAPSSLAQRARAAPMRA